MRTWLGILLTPLVFDVQVLAALNLSLTHIWEDYRKPYKQFLMFFCRENRARFWAANSEIRNYIGALPYRDNFDKSPFLPPVSRAASPLGETFPESESNLEIKAGINGGARSCSAREPWAHLNFGPGGPSVRVHLPLRKRSCFLHIIFHVAAHQLQSTLLELLK